MPRLFRRGGVWWIGYRVPGEPHEQRESTRTRSRKEAVAYLREWLAGPRQDLTANELFDQLETDYQVQGRKSLDTLRYHLKPLRAALGGELSNQVTVESIRGYVQVRQRAGAANATINRELSALRRAFTLAEQAGLVGRSPKVQLLPERNVRQGTYTREEVERLCAVLPEHVRPVVWFAYYTGRRRGEILQLRWEDVHLKEGYITVKHATTKTGDPDRIPMVGPLRDLCRDLSQSRGDCPWVFHYRGRPFKTFRKAWKRAVRVCGLPDRLFHDLRRTVATDLIEAGVDRQVAMRVTGHRTEATFTRYQIIKSESVRDALETLGRHRSGE